LGRGDTHGFGEEESRDQRIFGFPLPNQMCRYRRFAGSGSIDEAEYWLRIVLNGPLSYFGENIFAGTFEARRMLIANRTFDTG